MQAAMTPSSVQVFSPSQVSFVVECENLISSSLPFFSSWSFPSLTPSSVFLGTGGSAVAGTGGGGGAAAGTGGGGGAVALTGTGTGTGGGVVAVTGRGVLVVLLFSFWFTSLLFSTLGEDCGCGGGTDETLASILLSLVEDGVSSFFFSSPTVLFGSGES